MMYSKKKKIRICLTLGEHSPNVDWSEILWDKGKNKRFQPNKVNRENGIQFLKEWLPSSQPQNMWTEGWYNSGPLREEIQTRTIEYWRIKMQELQTNSVI